MVRDGGFLGWRFWGKSEEEPRYLGGTQMTRLGSAAADAALEVSKANNFHVDTHSRPRSATSSPPSRGNGLTGDAAGALAGGHAAAVLQGHL